jgi:hypothetical protein
MNRAKDGMYVAPGGVIVGDNLNGASSSNKGGSSSIAFENSRTHISSVRIRDVMHKGPASPVSRVLIGEADAMSCSRLQTG